MHVRDATQKALDATCINITWCPPPLPYNETNHTVCFSPAPPPLHLRCVLVMHARDATQKALDAARINITWWGTLRSILLFTAIIFPLLTLVAVAVSLWRALLANKLNIHAPDDKWRKQARAYQVNDISKQWRSEAGLRQGAASVLQHLAGLRHSCNVLTSAARMYNLAAAHTVGSVCVCVLGGGEGA